MTQQKQWFADLLHQFFCHVASGVVEVYNEFSLQHELGLYLRNTLPGYKVQYERNVFDLFGHRNFTKREIDICVWNNERRLLAIELKYPKNGQYPETIFSYCKDVAFVEQILHNGFEQGAALILTSDRNFFRQAPAVGQIYDHFRSNLPLQGNILKPTGKRDESVCLSGQHLMRWHSLGSELHYGSVLI